MLAITDGCHKFTDVENSYELLPKGPPHLFLVFQNNSEVSKIYRANSLGVSRPSSNAATIDDDMSLNLNNDLNN